MKLTRILATVAAVCALGMSVAPALATGDGSPHFNSGPTAKVNSDGSLTISAKEAGLGNNTSATIDVSGSGTADYGCANGGRNIAEAKENYPFNVSSGPQTFGVRNGTTSVSLTITPPSATDAGVVCPSGQTGVLMSVTWQHDSYLDENTPSLTATDFATLGTAVIYQTKNGK